MLVFSKKVSSAIRSYWKALEINPNLAPSYYALAQIYFHLKQFEQAIICYLNIIKIKPDYPGVFFGLRDIMIQQNKVDDANYCYRSRLSPNLLKLFCELIPDGQNRVTFLQNQPENSFVMRLINGRAWVQKKVIAIINSNHQVVADLCDGNIPYFLHYSEQLTSPHNWKGNMAFLATRWSFNYYHWLFDCVPRLGVLSYANINLDSIDWFIFSDYGYSFQQQILEILGIPTQKIINSDQFPHIQAENLFVPMIGGFKNFNRSCLYLRDKFLNRIKIKQDPCDERIFISRAKASYRKLVNEDEIVNFLHNFGFTSVSLESLSVLEQVALLSTAKIVIAPHGAGLANIVFCNPGTKIIEIIAPGCCFPAYKIISHNVNLDYYALIGDNLQEYYTGTNQEQPPPNPPAIEDIFLKIDSLLKLMKSGGII